MIPTLAATAIFTSLGLSCFEWLKHHWLSGIPLWESQLLTTAFVSTAATLAAYFFLRRPTSGEGPTILDPEGEHQRLDEMLNNVPAIVFEDFLATESEPRRGFVSSYVQGMFGYSREEWQSTPDFWLERVHPEDREHVAAEAAALFTEDGFRHTMIYRWLSRDGQIIWGESRLLAVRSADGRILGVRGVIFDVTERKLAEANLKESKRFLRSALDALSAHIGILDEHGLIIAVNGAWSRFATGNGASPAGYGVGENYLEVCDRATGECAAEAIAMACGIREVIAGCVPEFHLEYPCHSPMEQRWFIAKVTRFQGDGPVKVVVAHENITSRKLAEEAVREKDAIFRIASRVTKTGGWTLEIPSLQIVWSDEVFAILEFPVGTAPQLSEGLALFPEPWRSRISAAVKACAEQGVPFDLEVEVFTGRGRRIWVRSTAEAELHADGTVRRVQGAFQDISERRRAEEELRWKTAFLEAQVESYAVGLLVVDHNGKKVLQNQRMTDLWQMPQEIANDRDDSAAVKFVLSRLRSPEAFRKKVVELYAHPEACSSDEIELLDGTILDRYSAPVTGKDGRYYGRIWAFTDITEKKRAEVERTEMHQRLLDASRQAGMAEVASSVLHNVGNVLNSVNISCAVISEKVRGSRISGVAKVADLIQANAGNLSAFFSHGAAGSNLPEFMEKLAARLSEEQSAVLEELRLLIENVEHIKGIVAMQQNYGRASSMVETVNVIDLVEDSLRMNADSLTGHEIEPVREYDTVPSIAVDKHKVLQILVNLIRNGRYACSESGRKDKLLIFRVNHGGEKIRIAVIDNGIGISAENRTRIFSHGFTTRKNGHGFGLHSAVLAAREMGGSLTVQSDGIGTGATFTLELPITSAAAKPAALSRQPLPFSAA